MCVGLALGLDRAKCLKFKKINASQVIQSSKNLLSGIQIDLTGWLAGWLNNCGQGTPIFQPLINQNVLSFVKF